MSIQQKISRLKGVADIVFCIDFSGSMNNCIEGVKNHITQFVSSLENANPNMSIDWRIGFCGYSNIDFVKYDFSKSAGEFSRRLASAATEGGDEFTPGAIDFCISSFEWRQASNKFLIVFTDEPLGSGGGEELVRQGRDRFNDLLTKITESHVRLFYFGPDCPYYRQFGSLSRAMAIFNDDFSQVDFSDLLSSLGKTVSQSCTGQGGTVSPKLPYVYDLSSIKVTIL